MPVICQTFSIAPWDYYDRLSYVDWAVLRAYVDQVNEQARTRR